MQRQREAILLALCDPMPTKCEKLRNLSERDWRPLLYWMDVSGLALYFLDRITQLGHEEWLPPSVLSRLSHNLEDSKQRTQAMIFESSAIQETFQASGLSYAVLKGFSLWPVSVPRLELRSQLDLDFLMAESHASEAQKILEARGYHLRAISGRTWEFKSNGPMRYSIDDLYRIASQRCVELHLESSAAPCDSLLARIERRNLQGVNAPVLAQTDLFLGQGLHLYKHVCSESFRAAHLVEFRRHILVRFHDATFWQQLRELAERNPRAPAALGVVTLLISHVMGNFAPEALTDWTVDCLPTPARLWVEHYGRHAVFGSEFGSKLYLLLQQEMDSAGISAKRPLRDALVPRWLPPLVFHGTPGETLGTCVMRYLNQTRFILRRLRFHAVEGMRYLWESASWRSRVEAFNRSQHVQCQALAEAQRPALAREVALPHSPED